MITLALLTAAFVAAAVLMRRRLPPSRADVEDPVELAEAEEEVRDLPVDADPEEGFLGDDWGPGASGRPRD